MFEPKIIGSFADFYQLSGKTVIRAPGAARGVGGWLQRELGRVTGSSPRITTAAGRKGGIELALRGRSRASEEYRLAVSAEGVRLSATGPAGLRYAAQTLLARFDAASGCWGGCVVEDAPAVPLRAHLIHLTHYDSRWRDLRWCARPFDMDVARRVVAELGKLRYNYVVIDVGDAVRFRSNPKLARSWSAPMRRYVEIVRLARSLGMGVIPKFNFAKSPRGKWRSNDHNGWFRPYDRLRDDEEYFGRAFGLIDELISADKPAYFHIGMDEDFERTLPQYVRCIKILRRGLTARGIKTMRWVDLEKRWQPRRDQIKHEKAIELLPKDIVNVVWGYVEHEPFRWVGRLRKKGYNVMGGSGGNGARGIQAERLLAVRALTREVVKHDATGMLSTAWLPLRRHWEKTILDVARFSAEAYWRGG